MKRAIPKGKCIFCNELFSKQAMTRHLKSCKKRKEIGSQDTKKKRKEMFHIVVDCPGIPEYWMHLEVPANFSLEQLDGFLRNIWLECCGHLSAFTIDGVRYSSYLDADGPIFSFIGDPFFHKEEDDMESDLIDVVEVGKEFSYEYDFGSTTELRLKIADKYETPTSKASIKVLSRNEPVEETCVDCEQPATQVCTECYYESPGTYCDKCLPKHDCGDDMALPLVNSPRAGVCGYTGED
jgi:hypothetical protein